MTSDAKGSPLSTEEALCRSRTWVRGMPANCNFARLKTSCWSRHVSIRLCRRLSRPCTRLVSSSKAQVRNVSMRSSLSSSCLASSGCCCRSAHRGSARSRALTLWWWCFTKRPSRSTLACTYLPVCASMEASPSRAPKLTAPQPRRPSTSSYWRVTRRTSTSTCRKHACLMILLALVFVRWRSLVAATPRAVFGGGGSPSSPASNLSLGSKSSS
mmetsp:Transcript_550/g.1504  ORF Transcript_550/g.1504 Transcript_550/m.1504 type:complete len:214 (-) Transcript_550:34-675(-)